MDRRKYLGRAWGGDYFKTFTSKVIRVDEAKNNGYASLIQIEEVNRPYIVGENTCIADNGYSAITFLPDGEFWCVEAIYNNNNNIVEWYFDITKENSVDEDGKPYMNDLYLDAALLPDGQILVFDEDEIKEALDNNTITQKEYEMVYDVLRELKEKNILDVAYMEKLFTELRVLFLEESL
jgi:predicted RNA-binding protein associated with RNAse of E/G family